MTTLAGSIPKRGTVPKRELLPRVDANDLLCEHMPSAMVSDVCDLALPAKIVRVSGRYATADFGDGIIKEVNVSLVSPKGGDVILVHAGYAVQVPDEEEVKKTLEGWSDP